MTKAFFQLIIFSILVSDAYAQELESKVTINSSKVSSEVDPKVFQTLQAGLQNFINNRKWTNETFQPNERIVCSFLLTIQKELGTNLFQATLIVQAARPVYNSSYQTALMNFQDDAM